jgi:hypothetical protein
MISQTVVRTVILALNAAGIGFILVYLLVRFVGKKRGAGVKNAASPGVSAAAGAGAAGAASPAREEDLFKDVDLKSFDDLSLDDLD